MSATFYGESEFNEAVTFHDEVKFFNNVNLSGNVIGDINGDVVGNLTGNVSGDITSAGISTFSSLRVSSSLYDGNNIFGSSGQILSSDGTKTAWINASGATVGAATSVGTNLDSTNVSRLVTFVENTSGNNIIRVDSDLTYNPSTNALTAGSFVKSGGTSSQFLKADGTIDSNAYITSASIPSSFPSGTLMLFQQTAAPTGWTKQTTHNNKALRVVSGSASFGGSTAFTSVFTSRTPSGSVTMNNAAFTLTTNEIPSHSHTITDPGHVHSGAAEYPGSGPEQNQSGGPEDRTTFNVNTGSSTTGITINSTGGGASHTHNNTASFSGTSMDFDVQFVDLIIASKD